MILQSKLRVQMGPMQVGTHSHGHRAFDVLQLLNKLACNSHNRVFFPTIQLLNTISQIY